MHPLPAASEIDNSRIPLSALITALCRDALLLPVFIFSFLMCMNKGLCAMSIPGASGGRKRASDPSPDTGIRVSHQLPHGCWDLNRGFSTGAARALSHWSISPPPPIFSSLGRFMWLVDLSSGYESSVLARETCFLCRYADFR